MAAGAFTATSAQATPSAIGPSLTSTFTQDTAYYWNDTLLEIFRRQGGGPGPLARGAAMMHGAMFDVVNSAKWSRQNYNGSGYWGAFTVDYPSKYLDDDLAASIAARTVLSDAFPAHAAYITQRYTARIGSKVPDQATTALANNVIAAVRSNRSGDGSADTTPYALGNTLGAWRPTGDGCTTAVDPNWGKVRPFAMTSSTQARQAFPGGATSYAGVLQSQLYTTDYNEVKSLGSRTSTTRTATQTQTAYFWANDANGTYKPPGQLLSATRNVLAASSKTPLDKERIFALVSFAMADAGIAAWDEKYQTSIDLWRPVTAIQLGGADTNPSTVGVQDWQPLAASTPCFPSWVSGHATFAGAWAGILNSAIGSSVAVTIGTEDANAVGVTRTYPNFATAANEDARSRVYLGVHYQFDAVSGLQTGASVATKTIANKMQPFSCPSTDPNAACF